MWCVLILSGYNTGNCGNYLGQPLNIERTAFFLSDGTGLTAEGLGQRACLPCFEKIDFERNTVLYN